MTWRKSTYSLNAGNCVEAASSSAAVLVRDTNDRGGVTLDVTAEAWRAFTARIKA